MTASAGAREDGLVDDDLLQRISTLIAEEHALERAAVRAGDPVDAERLRALEVALDQCWDLLRQRRARRSAGQDPEDAQIRGESTVEGYQQ
ncbi:MAG: DUF2630 family protein [Acidimicrobiia bacterium]